MMHALRALICLLLLADVLDLEDAIHQDKVLDY